MVIVVVQLRGNRAPPAIVLSLEDLRGGAMSSSPFSGPNPSTYGVPFVVVSEFPTIVSLLQGLIKKLF
ncbi:hypothetical protein ACFXTN_017690 [Malus domestica]